MKAKYKTKLFKIMLIIVLITHFSCYIVLAAEMSADNYTKLTNNIVSWKNIDNIDIALANGQEIATLTTERKVLIQEQEEEILHVNNNLDLCLILDCSGSMNTSVEGTTRMDKLKSASKNLLERLASNYQLRVTLITYGEKFDSPTVGEDVFSTCVWEGYYYGGRARLNFEKNKNKVFDVIDNLDLEWITPTGEAINFADEYWNRSQGLESVTKINVLVTDGEPNRRC